MTSSLPPVAQELWWVTCADDLLDLHAGDVNLFGKLAHCLIGVLIGEGVNVDFHSRRYYWGFSTKNRKVNLSAIKQDVGIAFESKIGNFQLGSKPNGFGSQRSSDWGGGGWGQQVQLKRLTVLLQFLCVL